MIPALTSGIKNGTVVRIDGPQVELDFTFLDDVVDGFMKVMDTITREHRSIDPLHFVSGVGTRLDDLVKTIEHAVDRVAKIIVNQPRSLDVPRFIGCPEHAFAQVGWRAPTILDAGLEIYLRRLQAAAAG